MHVLADRCALGDRLDHRLPEILRVGTRESNALDAVDGVTRAQKLTEVGADAGQEVTAPRVHVLAKECELAYAVGGKATHLGDDLTGPTRHLPPSDGRDDAIGAFGVAAHRDLPPGLERALAMHRQLGREVAVVKAESPARDAAPPRPEPLTEVRDRAR